MSAAADDLPSRIGRFEIRREIGRGMMGVVYEAHDPVLGRTVALKVIALALAGSPSQRGDFEQRFLAEARIAARLSHPGIVVIHDVGRDVPTGTLYMALEHLSGRTLEELIAQGRPLEWREALRIVGRVAAALHHAHAQGVVHRDVKPANIMLLDSGDPKIMDFGIAKLVVEGHATSTGQLLGTPLYMAPEQARGERVDARTDIFSLGAIGYSLLTGRRAFQARSIPTILARVLHYEPPPPSEVVAGLPAALDQLVARAMAKAPADRYPTAMALSEDVEDVLAGLAPRHLAGWTPPPVGAHTLVSAAGPDELELIDGPPTPSPPPTRRRGRRDARPRFLAMVLLGGGIGIAAAGLLRFEVLPPVEPEAPGPIRMTWKPPPAVSPSPEASPSPAPLGTAPPESLAEAAVASPLETGTDDARSLAGSEPTPAPSPEEVAPAREPETPPLAAAPTPGPSEAEAAGAPPSLPSPSPAPTREAEARAEAKDKARLALHLDPTLRAKSVKVWVDGKLLVDEKLDPSLARRTQALRADSPLKVISLSPGRRQVRVQVRDEGGLRGERLLVTLKAGVGRRLDVKPGRASTALSFVLR